MLKNPQEQQTRINSIPSKISIRQNEREILWTETKMPAWEWNLEERQFKTPHFEGCPSTVAMSEMNGMIQRHQLLDIFSSRDPQDLTDLWIDLHKLLMPQSFETGGERETPSWTLSQAHQIPSTGLWAQPPHETYPMLSFMHLNNSPHASLYNFPVPRRRDQTRSKQDKKHSAKCWFCEEKMIWNMWCYRRRLRITDHCSFWLCMAQQMNIGDS